MTSNTAHKADLLGLDDPKVWDTESAFRQLLAKGQAASKRTAERRLNELQLLQEELTALSGSLSKAVSRFQVAD